MTTILTKVQQFLDSDDTNGAREEVARTFTNLRKVDATVRDFAALLALGSQKALEIGLGVLGRVLLNKDQEFNTHAVWLILAAVLSRQNITSDSPSRISILGLTSCVEDWELPIFALLTPALDSFFRVSLYEENPLMSEQTLDFISTNGESYAKAPRTKKQIKNFKSLAQLVLDKVDDLDIKEEWAEGLDKFFQIAGNNKSYSDQRIWSDASNLLKKIYSPEVLNRDTEPNNSYKVKENIFRLITSSLAALGTILGSQGKGLSVAVRIDNSEENKPWSVVASAIDKLERLFQEVADVTFDSINQLPAFKPAQAIPGSWTIILHIAVSDNQSNSLARAITSLSSTEHDENEINKFLLNSWVDCVEKFKEDDIRVNLAVSTNDPELQLVQSISTEDIPKVEQSLHQNIRVLSRDIPQANNLERVLSFASLLLQYPSTPSTVKQKFLEINNIQERQFFYYRRSVEILGLADERQRPTTACDMLNRLPSREAKMRFLAYQFISSNVGSAWFKWQNANDLLDIQPETASDFLGEVCPSLAEETDKRRVQTLQAWIRIFRDNW